ncbi:MAG: hypothetical protein K8J31_14145 [Anaerolineae bacterium]|nr:hypothetical protein [Anaerolineae bacterium]
MLDDLRRDALENDFEEYEEEDDPLGAEPTSHAVERRFLGMTAVERMFLSIFIFMNVFVLGLAILIATQRIVL